MSARNQIFVEARRELRLYVGGRFTGVTVRPDSRYPGMWRVHSADGRASGMTNLTRAKDAAVACARPKGLGKGDIARWDTRESATAASPVRQNAPALGEPTP